MRALVTGGAGFIGSHLTDLLINEGHDVTVLDLLSTGNFCNVNPKAKFACMDLGKVGMRSLPILKDLDVVFHLAALASVPQSIENPLEAYQHGLHMTAALIEEARLLQVKRFVFASSCSVYSSPHDSVAENMPRRESERMDPQSPYAAGKAAGELLVQTYSKCYPIDSACLRFFNVYGPRQLANSSYSGVIAAFCGRKVQNKPIDIFGDGLQKRDFIYVGDVARACYLAGTCEQPLGGESLNVGTGVPRTVLEVADELEIKDRNFLPARQGDTRAIHASTKRTSSTIGFNANVSFEDGIRLTREWYESQKA